MERGILGERMSKQIELGNWGEELVVKKAGCPKCKKISTLKKLVQNFKCADLICEFCGFIAQVKTKHTKNIEILPKSILGAAWGPQQARMAAGIYTSLYVVLTNTKHYTIFFIPAELQIPEMFVPRKPLSETAKRAGWQGFRIDTELTANRFVKIAEG